VLLSLTIRLTKTRYKAKSFTLFQLLRDEEVRLRTKGKALRSENLMYERQRSSRVSQLEVAFRKGMKFSECTVNQGAFTSYRLVLAAKHARFGATNDER
jgi:hypothetical protein